MDTDTIKGKDIIVVGIQPWDIEIGSNCKNIAIEFARNNRVLYVNAPVDRVSMYKERKSPKMIKRAKVRKGTEPSIVKISENLWNLYPVNIVESINWIGSKPIFDALNRINAKRFAKDILKAADTLGFKDYILFNDSSMFLGLHLGVLLNPKLYVYYMRDYLVKHPYWKRHGERVEPLLIGRADLVVNNSDLYAEYGAKYNKHSYMVGQGCDTDLFNEELREINIAEDLKPIPKPIVGYVGFLSSRRLDIKLLESIAKEMPEVNIVFVGPEDETFKNSSLHSAKNVFFLGSRDPSSLPQYIKGFDVAINPQLINDATMGNYPRKIDEYLAMGKPVVATHTKAMNYFADYAYLGKTEEDYVSLIRIALKDDNCDLQKRRRVFGVSHSWENNVNLIYKYLRVVSKEKGLEL